MLILCLIKKMQEMIHDSTFASNWKTRVQDFTRRRKLSFDMVITMILSVLGRSLQAGIDQFLQTLNMEYDTLSKQAFSQARQRIRPEAFKELQKMSIEFYYNEVPYKTYSNFRISAVDGSKMDLPYHKELMETYGSQPGTNGVIQALCSCLVDVQNNIVLDGIMAPCNGSERELAKHHLKYLEQKRLDGIDELITFDRGYPSADLMAAVENAGMYYVMRCSQSFIESFKKKLTGNDCVITHKFSKSGLQLTFRVISFPISDKEDEILITNVMDSEMTIQDFKDIYHMRWGIETTYNCTKNMFEIENFTGATPCAVLQDFYATLFLYNVVSVIIYESEAQQEKQRPSKEKEKKYEYKINVNLAVQKVKDNFIYLVSMDSTKAQERRLARLIKQLAKEVVPIRPDRHYSHTRKHPSVKYSQNQKK